MISASNIFIKYGDRVLLDHINFVIQPKDKVGLTGRNGAGKSTILKLLADKMTPDDGRIEKPANCHIGYLSQELNLPEGKTVMEEALSAFEEARKLENKIDKLNKEIAERDDYDSKAYENLLIQLSDANERFRIIGGISMEAEAERVLKGLGFKSEDMARPTSEFSGGWKMRIELAKILLQKPDYLLLDEPTNHLDIESILWLENFLKDYFGCVVLISHDKQFLDTITQRTLEVELGKIYDYKANYSNYLHLRDERREQLEAAYKNQQKQIAQRERTITRFMAKATKTKMAQSMKKQLDKLERIELDDVKHNTLRIQFPPAPRSGEVVVKASELSKAFGTHSVLEKVDLQLIRGERLAFVGQNGQGKTTLAKILMGQLEKSGGELELGYNLHIGYYAQNQSESLDPTATLIETLEAVSPPDMRTKLRGILGAFLFTGEDVDKKVSVLSGGEKARLAMACLLLRPVNFLVLDEPTNHLDIPSKEVLKNALNEYEGSLIVVSHDRDFLQGLTTRTIEFRDKKLFNYIGDVNAFLGKRRMNNMRQVEMASEKAQANTASQKDNKLSHQERKKLQRAVQNAERRIEKLEEKIADMETEMANPEFFTAPDATEKMAVYEKYKKELAEQMEAWEEAVGQLEE